MHSPLTFIFKVGFVMMLAGSAVQAADGGNDNCGAWAFWTACQAHGGGSMPQPNFDFKDGVDHGGMTTRSSTVRYEPWDQLRLFH